MKAARVTTLTLAGLLAFAASACTGGDPDLEPDPGESPAPASPPPAAECFPGTFQVESIDSNQALDTPLGPATAQSGWGSLTLAVEADGSWTLADDGSEPVTFDLVGVPVEATIEGSAIGTYVQSGDDDYVFTMTGATGGGRIEAPIGSHEFSMEDAATVLAPGGASTVTCEGDQATLTSETVVMGLTRLG